LLEAERLRARALVRRHRRATIVLAVFAGVVAGATMGVWAIARSTGGAYDRFVAWVDQGDGQVYACHPELSWEEIRDDLEALCNGYDYADVLAVYTGAPEVATAGRWTYTLSVVAPVDDPAAGWRQLVPVAIDEGALRTFGQPIVVAGRRADPTVATEATINEELADRLGLGVGDQLVVTPYRRDEFDVAGEGAADPGGRATTVDVVGIERWPSDLAGRLGGMALNDDAGRVLMGPAWWEHIDGDAASYGISVAVVMAAGAEPGRMRDLFEETWPDRPFDVEMGPFFGQVGSESIVDAIDLQALSVTVMALVVGCAGLLFVGQTLARQSRREWDDTEILDALGMSTRQRCGGAVLRSAPMAVGAAALAGIVAVAVAQAGPIGIAGAADTSRGVQVDATVLLVGLPATLVFVVVCVVVPVWRRRRATTNEVRPMGSVPDIFGSPSARAGWALTAARRGGRLALASAIVGTMAAATAGIAAIAVTASYDDLLEHPGRFGSTWDATVANVGSRQQEIDARRALEAIPGIDVTGITTMSGISGDPFFSLVAGVPFLGERQLGTIVAGRAPAAPTEVALGRRSMEALDVRIGDEVTFVDPFMPVDDGSTFEVVGEAVINDSIGARPGTGALITADAVRRLDPEARSQTYAVWVHPAVDRDGTLAAVREAFPTTFVEVSVPMQVRNVGLVDRQPLLLALVIGVLAGAALLHALVTSVRASRGQIGVLRALGFTPGQVGGSVAWHATAIAGAGLLVGVPLGIVTGRLLWRMIADDLGLESPTALPVLAVIAVVVLVLVVANLASYVPGRLAATTRPAEALRVE
jgi:hypothetical protein